VTWSATASFTVNRFQFLLPDVRANLSDNIEILFTLKLGQEFQRGNLELAIV
jgi:hypothetical protein